MLLNKHNLGIAALASKENSRYTIQGIHITSTHTEVTDGHMAVRVTLPQVDEKIYPAIDGVLPDAKPDYILPAEVAKKIITALPKKTSIPILVNALAGKNGNGTPVLAVTDLDTPLTYTPRMLTGQYPNLNNVLPKIETKKQIQPGPREYVAVSLDGNKLIQLLQQLVAFKSEDRYATVKLIVHDSASAIQLQACNTDTGQNWDALLMPLRDEITRLGQKQERESKPAEPTPEPTPVTPSPSPEEQALAAIDLAQLMSWYYTLPGAVRNPWTKLSESRKIQIMRDYISARTAQQPKPMAMAASAPIPADVLTDADIPA